jgi:hypothetical protein
MNKTKVKIEKALVDAKFIKVEPDFWALFPYGPDTRPWTRRDVRESSAIAAEYHAGEWKVIRGLQSVAINKPQDVQVAVDLLCGK